MNLRKHFYENILISGGTSMLPGFPTRLLKEVGSRFKERILKGGSTSSIKIRVIDPPSRKYNVFIGASIVAAQTNNYDEGWKVKK
jgi:actin-related protein 2